MQFLGPVYPYGLIDVQSSLKDPLTQHPQVNLLNDKTWSGTLDKLIYDLTDLNLWEHLLAGEPFHRRNMAGVDPTDKSSAVETEKHLDMPASWVEKLDITADGKLPTLSFFLVWFKCYYQGEMCFNVIQHVVWKLNLNYLGTYAFVWLVDLR